MRILYVSTEVVPFAKTGGLADVAAAFPRSLEELGHEPLVVMPYWRSARQSGWPIEPTGRAVSIEVAGRTFGGPIMRSTLPGSYVPIFFIGCDELFDRDGLYGYSAGEAGDDVERFSFFCRAVLETVRLLDLRVDVIHLNDWMTALIAPYLATLYAGDEALRGVRTLLTIHNAAYQGIFPGDRFAATGLPLALFGAGGLEFRGKVNLLKGGIVFADRINAVSETYAAEIQTPQQGFGLDALLRERKDDLSGITNGIDVAEWDPATDKLIASRYTALNLAGKTACKRALQKKCGLLQVDVPLVGTVSRLTDQKGFDLLDLIHKELMKQEFQFVLLGTGEEKYHKLFAGLKQRFPSRCSAYLGFDNRLAHQIEAGADIYLMPSHFEPCGLNQMYSMRYGTVPVVHKTGGLADTVCDYTPEGLDLGLSTGFVFDRYTPADLLETMIRVFELWRDRDRWRRLVRNGMARDFSWSASARKYVRLYEQLTAREQEGRTGANVR